MSHEIKEIDPPLPDAPRLDVLARLQQPRLHALLFSDWLNTTNDGKHNLIGTYDRITITKGNTARIGLFIRLSTTELSSIIVFIFSPAGEWIGQVEITATPNQESVDKMTEEEPFTVQGGVQLNIPDSGEGLYWFEVAHQEQSLGGVHLKVIYKPEEENGTGD